MRGGNPRYAALPSPKCAVVISSNLLKRFVIAL